MKYLVTGGAGFIGSHLVQSLLSDNDVVILDNFSTGFSNNLDCVNNSPRLKIFSGSITDYETVSSVLDGVDGIFHLAALASVPRSIQDPLSSHEANATGTLTILKAAYDSGVRKVVCASSSSVYGDTEVLPKYEEMTPRPLSPYAVSKLSGEYYCDVFTRNYGIQTVSLRFFNVYGPRQNPDSPYAAVIPRFISSLLSGDQPQIFGDGTQTRDFTYVQDVVDANILAMNSSRNGVYNIAAGNRVSILGLLDIIEEILGTSAHPVFLPPRRGDIHDSYARIIKAREELQFNPQYSLKDGLKEVIEWFKSKK